MLRKVVEWTISESCPALGTYFHKLTKFILINTITMTVLVEGLVKKYRGRGGGGEGGGGPEQRGGGS